jgi:hypothetical protein
MATKLSEVRKKSIRDKLRTKIQSAGYKKGHVSKTTGMDIKDVKPVKKEVAPTLSKSDPKYTKKMAARKYAAKHKTAMGAKGKVTKAFKQGAVKGKQVAHAKKVGAASVAAGKPKGPGLKYTAANKAWRVTAMAAAKEKTGVAKKRAMQDVDRKYRKKVGLKAKTYT